MLCSDHGQTRVDRTAALHELFPDAIVAASNRAGMIYGDDPRALAQRLDGHEAVETALFLENGEAVARRDGVDVPLEELGYPDGPGRIRAALANRNAGEVILSAAPGWEFADLGGGHHAGGGSHGSLTVGDSEVPMLTIGIPTPPESITGVAPAILEHLGVPLPDYVHSVGPVR